MLSEYELCHHGVDTETVGGIVGTSRGPNVGEVVVTVQGAGVYCYNTANQSKVAGWPLGTSAQTFATPAIWDAVSDRYFALLQHSAAGSSSTCSLLSWGVDDQGPPLDRLSSSAPLPSSVQALCPAFSAGIVLKDWKGDLPGGVLVASKDGSIIQWGAAGTKKTRGTHKVRANLFGLRKGDAGLEVACTASFDLLPPTNDHSKLSDLQPATATFTDSCISILWSDNTFAVYRLPEGSSHGAGAEPDASRAVLECTLWRYLASLPDPAEQDGAVAASAGKTPGKSKKRAAAASSSPVPSTLPSTCCAAVQGGYVVVGVAGKASTSLVLLDTLYGCVHASWSSAY
ncbi:hypothetical protein CYMTET_9840, partial [Cymbomonas tetramitiformis]